MATLCPGLSTCVFSSMVSLQSSASLSKFPICSSSQLLPSKHSGKADTRDPTLTAADSHLGLRKPNCRRLLHRNPPATPENVGQCLSDLPAGGGQRGRERWVAHYHSCLTQDVPWAHPSFCGDCQANDEKAHRAEGVLCQSPETIVPEYFWLLMTKIAFRKKGNSTCVIKLLSSKFHVIL